MGRETERKHLDGAIAVATEALQHLQRGSVVGVKYHEGGSIDEVGGPAVIVFKLEVEALDLTLRDKVQPGVCGATRNDDALAEAVRLNSPEEVRRRSIMAMHRLTEEANRMMPVTAATGTLDETTIRSILMGVFLGSTTMTIDRAVKKLLDAQGLAK